MPKTTSLEEGQAGAPLATLAQGKYNEQVKADSALHDTSLDRSWRSERRVLQIGRSAF